MKTYTVDVLHAFPLFPGDSLDGMGLQERTFVESGRNDIRARVRGHTVQPPPGGFLP